MATKVSADGAVGVGVPVARAGRTLALVDLRHRTSASGESPPGGATGFGRTLREIERAVRGEDRVCPFGTLRVAVAFGPDADTVSPRTLAQRLARAVRRSSILDATPIDQYRRSPATKDAASPPAGTKDIASPPVATSLPSSARIVVDRMIGWATSTGGSAVDAATTTSNRIPSRLSGPTRGLWHRTVVRYSSGGFARYGTRHDDIVPGESGTILMVSPCRAPGSAPGLSAVAASAMAERLGYRVRTMALSCDDELVLDIDGLGAELAVLVIEGEREPTSDRTTWSSSTWHIPAQLTARFTSMGVRVLAVGAGGGAGALASCIAQGADVVLDLDELQVRLRRAVERPIGDELEYGLVGGEPIPEPMEALVLLTASERRVLFYLTIGRSAQEIADELVVSVTTVRSHIRSILRKLGVRSQIAAVAIANSQDFERKPGASANEARRELEAPGVA